MMQPNDFTAHPRPRDPAPDPVLSATRSDSSSSLESSTSSRDGDSDSSATSLELSPYSTKDSAQQASRPYALPPSSAPLSVLPEDARTPDNFVERDPRLIRLTGTHPFNVEAPLTDLFDEGFITSKNLHYVRNHGPVPRVEDPDIMSWEFSVEGLVSRPIKMTLRDLLQDYEQVTYPVTLVCAGNRRKEQNLVRKTKGFSWGPAGVSNSLWTGVAIGELLKRAKPKRRARYVCFEGADELPNGYYGTSIRLSWCMDPARGVMVAHGMNGEPLHPDHGKPLRIIIPGQIGGRSVKWLKRIIVTEEPSTNWYHIYDNRVLPTTISPEQSANLPDLWKDERYAIYDLNVNSATARPAHDERLTIQGNELAAGGEETYKVEGYAYAGGGRRITRVEVSLDKGKNWTLAQIRYPEDDYRRLLSRPRSSGSNANTGRRKDDNEKDEDDDEEDEEDEMLFGGRLDMSWRESSFCWCFWHLDMPVSQLAKASDIVMRAMDDGMMTQPKDMYWSVMGMMNNPWYRIVIHRENEGRVLRFEHPTLAGLQSGGWMERVKKAGGDLSNGNWGERHPGEEESGVVEEAPQIEVSMINEKIKKEISLEEVKRHDGEDVPWFVLKGEVYDGTEFLKGHPGGAASITGAAGQDVTEEFMAIHSENAKGMMPTYHIGSLDAVSLKALTAGESEDSTTADPANPRPQFLQSKVWSKALLHRKKIISQDTRIFTFKLDYPEQDIGLPTGQHLMMRLRDPATREAIIRAYTPLSQCTAKGELDILIKIYHNTPDRKGGKMTVALDSIPVGHFVDFKGPVGHFEYLGKGACTISGEKRQVKKFVMICGGSGITPIFQVLRAVMQDQDDSTQCVVLDGNRVEEDILCRTELDDMHERNRHKCRLVHTLSKAGPEWAGLRGRVDGKLLDEEIGRYREGCDDTLVLICGPGAMEKMAKETLAGMGWGEKDLLFF